LKTVFFVLILLSFALKSTAAVSAELCQLEAGGVPGATGAFTELETLNIKDVVSLTAGQLSFVNQHLLDQEYTSEVLNLADIKALFSGDGEQASNDLFLYTFASAKSGKVYVQVKSWPGENPYAHIFAAESGVLVALNRDDSVSLITESGSQTSCSDLKE